jgi:hypothetical protein
MMMSQNCKLNLGCLLFYLFYFGFCKKLKNNNSSAATSTNSSDDIIAALLAACLYISVFFSTVRFLALSALRA